MGMCSRSTSGRRASHVHCAAEITHSSSTLQTTGLVVTYSVAGSICATPTSHARLHEIGTGFYCQLPRPALHCRMVDDTPLPLGHGRDKREPRFLITAMNQFRAGNLQVATNYETGI
jgi:hypothetical protein